MDGSKLSAPPYIMPHRRHGVVRDAHLELRKARLVAKGIDFVLSLDWIKTIAIFLYGCDGAIA